MLDPHFIGKDIVATEVKQLAQDHIVRGVGSKFKSGNVCQHKVSLHVLPLPPRKYQVRNRFYEGEEQKCRELGHCSRKTGEWQGPMFLTASRHTGIGGKTEEGWELRIRGYRIETST